MSDSYFGRATGPDLPGGDAGAAMGLSPSALQQARLTAGMSPADAAERAGISVDHLALYEADIFAPDLDTVCVLAKVYDVDARWILIDMIKQISASNIDGWPLPPRTH